MKMKNFNLHEISQKTKTNFVKLFLKYFLLYSIGHNHYQMEKSGRAEKNWKIKSLCEVIKMSLKLISLWLTAAAYRKDVFFHKFLPFHEIYINLLKINISLPTK